MGKAMTCQTFDDYRLDRPTRYRDVVLTSSHSATLCVEIKGPNMKQHPVGP